jgi:hypothetical protein
MNREIPLSDVRPGDIILCDSAGPLAACLSFMISVFDSDWRNLQRKPWHVRFVSKGVGLNATVCEALSPVVCERRLTSIPILKQRAYRWFDDGIQQEWLDRWVYAHCGLRYDVLIYFWTAIVYLARAVWNRYIPRLLDDRYTCWELVMEMCEDAGKPMHSKRDCPLITDLCQAIGLLPKHGGEIKELSVVADREP